MVFPKRGNIPQSLNDGWEMVDDVIHLLFRIINGKAEADGAMGCRKRNPHRPEDMRRFERTRGAGRTRRGADAEVGEKQKDGFPFHIFKTDAHGVGKPMDAVPIDQGIGNLF